MKLILFCAFLLLYCQNHQKMKIQNEYIYSLAQNAGFAREFPKNIPIKMLLGSGTNIDDPVNEKALQNISVLQCLLVIFWDLILISCLFFRVF